MKAFKWLWHHTILYQFYDMCVATYTYFHDKNIVYDTLHSKGFAVVVKQYLHANLRSNWFGEVGCVVNPNINSDGEFDISSVIMELDGDNTNTNEYVRYWVYKQMRLIADLFKIEKLYDYINIDFEHVGPETDDNYLIMFRIASRSWFTKALKDFLIHAALLGGVCWFVLRELAVHNIINI